MYQFRLDSWNLAIRHCGTGSILSDTQTPFHVISNDMGSWAADPFLYEYDSKLYIFAEVYKYKFGRGVIGYTVYDPVKKSICGWKECIVEPYHLSFPYIYEDEGEIYIIPESNSGRCLSRYRALRFPDKWERVDINKGYRFADTALFDYNNKKYGYTIQLEENNPENQSARVFLFEDDRITEHHKVVDLFDKKTMRLGGAFFSDHNVLIKVAQDCSETYGGGIVFCEFKKSGQGFEDRIIKSIYPQDIVLDKRIRPRGMHTYNSTDRYEIIDIKTDRLSMIQRFWNLKRKLTRG